MRIHQLTLSAFGPFPGTHVVDFEELNDAGVFLVTGPTGAGKTSILDAVCFALFAQVPGARTVKALRSDHAEPEARPEVALDFSLANRRFVVRRSPEWARPKRRGDGTTLEKGSASLVEITDGTEHLLSSRAQEVGHFLSDLLGMTADQFQQVAMLPQGEFQTFLRATSQERHDVLQQLFRTERFTRIEDWVHDHSRLLREAAEGGESVVRRLVDTMADRADVPSPESLAGEALARGASSGAILPWARELVCGAEAALEEAAREHQVATLTLQSARVAHDDANRSEALRARRDEAAGVLALLADDADVQRGRLLLEAHDRAVRCLPLLRLVEQSTTSRQSAQDALARAASVAPDVADPAGALQVEAQRLARLEALLPRERELSSTRLALQTAEAALAELMPRIDAARSALDAAPVRRGALAQAVAEADSLAGGRAGAQAAVEAARSRATAAQALPAESARLAAWRDEAHAAREAAADARERLLDVLERRLAGMAGELAAALRSGDPCQVCGGTDHPSPAPVGADAVGESDQLAARAEADALRTVHEATLARLREAELRVSTLTQHAGGLTPEAAAEALQDSEAALAGAIEAERDAEQARRELAALDNEVESLTTSLRDLGQESARLTASVDALTASSGRLEAEIAAALDDETSLRQAISRQTTRIDALRALLEATTATAQADAEMARLTTAALDAAGAHGFETLQAVRDAALDEPSRETLARQLRDHDETLADATSVLADPAVTSLPNELPDAAAAKAALDEAADADAAAARTHHLAAERVTALQGQLARLEQALTAWAPAVERFLTADSLSRLVRGMSADNQLQMRLSAYVLATRLDQVVAAANERLSHMREHRYLLERTGDATRRRSQAGLGLRVLDEWTGETRDPATLSGGETFVVSLALALGLSDVVSKESGGVELATLFIDEGFGMLDLDTLDDVMDRLDGLRAGGRTVGVVSHVTELRNRIPTQLHVAKQRNGSSIKVTTLIA